LTPGQTALTAAELIATHSRRLGELDRDKAKAGARSEPGTDGRQVRNELIQLLSLVSAVAARSTAPAAVLLRIVGPLDEALARAAIGHPKPAAPAEPAAAPASRGTGD
jgi:hypothetical protein